MFQPGYLVLFLCCFQITSSLITVTAPPQYSKGLPNPLMGPRVAPWINNTFSRVWRQYIPYNELENSSTDGVSKIIAWSNEKWKDYPAKNIKVIPRVFLSWYNDNCCYPADMTKGDWTSEKMRNRIAAFINKLGQAWGNDSRVAWIQTGIISNFGEQETPVHVNTPIVQPNGATWASIMGPAFSAAFKNKKVLVRHQNEWTTVYGTYWDMFASYCQVWAYNDILNYNKQYGAYKTQIIEGETAPDDQCADVVANDPTRINNVIQALHVSALDYGRISDCSNATNYNLSTAMLKVIGYRFKINKFSINETVNPGGTLTVSFNVTNVASAPFYYNWEVALVLVNITTRLIVSTIKLSNVSITTWLPGDNFNYNFTAKTGTRKYMTPAPNIVVTRNVVVPTTVPKGQYLVGLTILEPTTQTPGIFFDVRYFLRQSQTQPLARIGVGVWPTYTNLTGVAFDDILTNDKRYYK